jgi:RNA polymerase sigma factor (sigma-70 family)
MTQRPPASRGRRPDVAYDMARALNVARAAVAMSAGALQLTDAVTTIVNSLDETANRGGREGLRPVSQTVCDRLERVISAPGALEPVWTIAERIGDLNATIVAANHAGVDGERLAWALIGYEALNHVPLVYHQANKLAASCGYVADDLVGWGWQGLRVALRQYDPTTFAFSTYACTRISGTIRDGVRAENPIPKRLGTEVRKMARAEEELAVELQRAPSLAEVAERMDMSWEHAQVLARCVPTASIEELTAEGYGRDPGVLRDETDTLDSALRALLGDDITTALASLDPVDAEAVRLLVLEERPVSEVREMTGATARQLRQRRQRGLEQLAESLAHWAA